jgi:hypothetical protein
MLDDAMLPALLARALGRPVTAGDLARRPARDHQKNDLYDLDSGGRHLIVKVFRRPDELETAPAREYGALRLVAPLDIAPDPVFFDPELGPVVVYAYLDGAAWDRRCPQSSELAELAQVWAMLHALPPEGLWLARGSERRFAQVYDRMRHQFGAYQAWANACHLPDRRAAERCLQLLELHAASLASLEAQPAVMRFCRSDPRFANVITRPDGRLAMVDWENGGLRDPARELADMLMHANQEDLLSWEAWQAFLRPYLAASAASDPDLWRRTELYVGAFALYWLAVLTEQGMRWSDQGRAAPWMVNGISGHIRLRRYMARALAWPELDPSAWQDEAASFSFFPSDL